MNTERRGDIPSAPTATIDMRLLDSIELLANVDFQYHVIFRTSLSERTTDSLRLSTIVTIKRSSDVFIRPTKREDSLFKRTHDIVWFRYSPIWLIKIFGRLERLTFSSRKIENTFSNLDQLQQILCRYTHSGQLKLLQSCWRAERPATSTASTASTASKFRCANE